MIIQHNMTAANANRQLGVTGTNLAKSTEKLSSGYRINRASDDAAGLAISEKMRGQIRGLNQASTNAQDGISMIQTAEGALSESQAILQRMRELSVQASNGTETNEDREAIQEEVSQLQDELTRIAETTEFNTMKLLDGTQKATVTKATIDTTKLATTGDTAAKSADIFEVGGKKYGFAEQGKDTAAAGKNNGVTFIAVKDTTKIQADDLAAMVTKINQDIKGATGTTEDVAKLDGTSIKVSPLAVNGAGVKLQVGANKDQTITFTIEDMSAEGLGVDAANVSVETQDDAENAITTIDNAINTVSRQRAQLGAVQNRLEHTIANLDTSAENLQTSESRIRDVNMADEMVKYSKHSILQQASQSMLAQAKNSTQGVLSLLQ